MKYQVWMGFVLILAGCAGGGQAPIENRSARGVLASEQGIRPGTGPIAPGTGRPSAPTAPTAPSGLGGSLALDKPGQPATDASVAGIGAPMPGGSGIKSTPLVLEPLRTPGATPPRGGSPGLSAAPHPGTGAVPSSESGLKFSQNPVPEARAENRVEPRPMPADPESVWVWPAAGRVLQSFEPGKTKGITLSGTLGDPVIAVADGKVIFSGQGPRGYGNLIIVKHPADLLSVYAHNRAVLVKEGASVVRGQRIAELGDTDSDRPKLHFEVRRQGRPVDPIQILPPR